MFRALLSIVFGLVLSTWLASASQYVPVYVMMPLNAISFDGLYDPTQLKSNLQQLKKGNVDGIMIDVWWGLVEQEPRQYNWSAYLDLANNYCKQAGLKMKVIMSFHECGGNVGDECDIPLPDWVTSVGRTNPDIWYTDAAGHRDEEYLSLGVDSLALFGGRSPVRMYADYMASFKAAFANLLGSVITEVQIGLGPAGEMRYPSYQLAYWSFPGVGEFQCYDRYMLADLAAYAKNASNDWTGPPQNAGSYNAWPSQTQFFTVDVANNFQSDFGQFFLEWYSSRLVQHGDRVLAQAAQVFGGIEGLELAAKVSGIHWQYKDASHAAELTAGYSLGYNMIADMFALHGVGLDFTCLEMRDSEQCSGSCTHNGFCSCAPEELVAEVEQAAAQADIGFSGENALPRYDTTAFETIEEESRRTAMTSFSFLRLGSDLLQSGNWQTFQTFVQSMHNLS